MDTENTAVIAEDVADNGELIGESADTDTDTPEIAADVTDAPEIAADGTDADEAEEDDTTDYAVLAMRDLAELAEIFPEVRAKRSITELSNPLRYAALRDLGLTPKEAYLATEDRRVVDNRAHLTSRVPSSARAGASLSGRELDMARELFSGLTEREIQRLYKKVNV
jgi:hypothetical protein